MHCTQNNVTHSPFGCIQNGKCWRFFFCLRQKEKQKTFSDFFVQNPNKTKKNQRNRNKTSKSHTNYLFNFLKFFCYAMRIVLPVVFFFFLLKKKKPTLGIAIFRLIRSHFIRHWFFSRFIHSLDARSNKAKHNNFKLFYFVSFAFVRISFTVFYPPPCFFLCFILCVWKSENLKFLLFLLLCDAMLVFFLCRIGFVSIHRIFSNWYRFHFPLDCDKCKCKSAALTQSIQI